MKMADVMDVNTFNDDSNNTRETGAAEAAVEVNLSRKRRNEKEVSMDTEDSAKRPNFPPVNAETTNLGKAEFRKVAVPSHRYTPLKENWMKIFTPVVEHLHLQIRFNLNKRNVEIRLGRISATGTVKIFQLFRMFEFENTLSYRKFELSRVPDITCKETNDQGALQKAEDFVKAFMLGFDVNDALALLRLDDLFLESFEVTDVKTLKGDHLSRAIGRVAGKGGKTKYTIENVTKTRIVLADSKIHILGSFQNIKIARTAICNLILGSPPSKVYGNMRAVAARSVEKF